MMRSLALLFGLLAVDVARAAPATVSSTKSTSTTRHTTSTTHKSTSTAKATSTTKHTTSTTHKSSSTVKATSTVKTTSAVKTTSTALTTSKSTSSVSPTPTKSSGKRGLSYNIPALTGLFSLSGQNSKVSWAYNWASDPYFGGNYPANSYNEVLDFVPMLWSSASSLTSIWTANVEHAMATYGSGSVLSFNEPDLCCTGCGSGCMNVSTAVAAYKEYVQPFAGRVKLGAPAVTNGVGTGLGINWLESFMSNCTGCQVDFIPLHWYGSPTDPNSFTSYVQEFYEQFNRPIWITEFGTDGGTDEQIIAFLQQVMPWLDEQSYVQRYAYFMDTAAGSPYLLFANETMTDIGVEFNSG